MSLIRIKRQKSNECSMNVVKLIAIHTHTFHLGTYSVNSNIIKIFIYLPFWDGDLVGGRKT